MSATQPSELLSSCHKTLVFNFLFNWLSHNLSLNKVSVYLLTEQRILGNSLQLLSSLEKNEKGTPVIWKQGTS